MSFEAQKLLTGLGAAFAIGLTAAGSAIASVEGGVFALRYPPSPKTFSPIIIAGVLAIYGVIVAVLLIGKMDSHTDPSSSEGYRHLSAGLSVGFACLASGYGMANVMKHCNSPGGTPTVKKSGNSEQTQPLIESIDASDAEVDWIRLIFVLIFMESIGLYGLIAALFLIGK